MSDRPYLSIGEVLGLLLEEFPDITISKIRFLESQGLIDPERTPSGYRKFYEHDVERLRVILREQRENYLPLRVIRDRLERGDIDADASGGQPVPRGVRNVQVPAASVAGHPAAAHTPAGHGPQPGRGDSRALGARASDSPTSSAEAVEGAQAGTRPSQAPADRSGSAAGPTGLSDETAIPGQVDGGQRAPGAAAPAERIRPATATPAPARRAGSSRTREELCAIAGVTADQLADLESYGLISGRGAGVATMYGDDECEIAAIAGQFLARGVDARHLRAWKTSADREAGLFEQRILPLLRQRNPQARQQAVAMLHELAELGGRLRAAMVHSAVRHLE